MGFSLIFWSLLWTFPIKYEAKYSVDWERQKAHWNNFFHIDVLTEDFSFSELAFGNIKNSPTWWKQISRVFKHCEIGLITQFFSFQKSEDAILQEISWEAKCYMESLKNIEYYDCCSRRRVLMLNVLCYLACLKMMKTSRHNNNRDATIPGRRSSPGRG